MSIPGKLTMWEAALYPLIWEYIKKNPKVLRRQVEDELAGLATFHSIRTAITEMLHRDMLTAETAQIPGMSTHPRQLLSVAESTYMLKPALKGSRTPEHMKAVRAKRQERELQQKKAEERLAARVAAKAEREKQLQQQASAPPGNGMSPVTTAQLPYPDATSDRTSINIGAAARVALAAAKGKLEQAMGFPITDEQFVQHLAKRAYGPNN
jgi:hypothetical protein